MKRVTRHLLPVTYSKKARKFRRIVRPSSMNRIDMISKYDFLQ